MLNMNLHTLSAAWLCALVLSGLAGLAGLAGCDSLTAMEARSVPTASEVRDRLVSIKPQLVNTTSSLNQLVAQTDADKYEQLRTFQRNEQFLSDQAQSIGKLADRLIRDGEKYFNTWAGATAMSAGGTAAQTEAQLREMRSRYDDFVRVFDDSRRDFRAYAAEVRSISEAIGNEPTREALDAVMDRVDNANVQANALKADVDTLVAKLDRFLESRS